MRLVLLALAMSFSSATFADSGLRDDVMSATKMVIGLEQQISRADAVSILDAYVDYQSSTIMLTVAPEKNDRPARLYNCWKISSSQSLKQEISRVHGEACREMR